MQHSRFQTGLQCASGGCIFNHGYQPNGNQMCMVNYDSLEVASESCSHFRCDLIVKYRDWRGIFAFQYIVS